VRWEHHVPRDVVGVRGAEVAADELQREVDRRTGARARGDVTMVDVQRVRLDGHIGIAPGEFVHHAPMGCRGTAVKKPHSGEQERA
jgi:hypothetical protein